MATRHGPRTPPRRKGQHLQPQKPPTSTWHLVARQGDQRGRSIWRWLPHHVHTAKKTSAALARPRLPYGGWPNTKRHPLRRACCRADRPWSAAAEVQRCVLERHEGTGH